MQDTNGREESGEQCQDELAVETEDAVRVQTPARRPSEIWLESVDEGDRRLHRTPIGMAATGFTGGIDVMVGVLALVLATHAFEAVVPSVTAHLLGSMFFGIGFVFVTIGRSELFTEDFLVPVAAALRGRARRRILPELWLITLVANLAALASVAYLLSVDGLFPDGFLDPIGQIADVTVARSVPAAFVSAIVAGTVMTLFTWFVLAATADIARIALALIVGFVLAAPYLNHAVVSFGELVLAIAVGSGHVSVVDLFSNLGVSTAGNLCGGVGLVTLTRLWQVQGEPEEEGEDTGQP